MKADLTFPPAATTRGIDHENIAGFQLQAALAWQRDFLSIPQDEISAHLSSFPSIQAVGCKAAAVTKQGDLAIFQNLQTAPDAISTTEFSGSTRA